MYIISKISLVYSEAQTPSKLLHPTKPRAKTEPSLQTDEPLDLQPSQSLGTTSDFHPLLRLPTSEQAVQTYGDTNVTSTGRKKCNLNVVYFLHTLDAVVQIGLSSLQVDTFDVNLFAR